MTDAGSHQGQDVVTRWCRAGERGEADLAAELLAPDVQLVSPLTDQFRFHGPEQIRMLLESVFAVVDGLQFHTRLDGEDASALFYRGRIGTQPLDEAQLLRLDEGARIREITLFGRPLPALTGVMSALAGRMARHQGRPGRAAVLTLSTASLHAMTRMGERRVVPLAAPATTAG